MGGVGGGGGSGIAGAAIAAVWPLEGTEAKVGKIVGSKSAYGGGVTLKLTGGGAVLGLGLPAAVVAAASRL